MYPFRSKARWLMAGPPAHLLRVLRGHPAADDPVIQTRSRQLAFWLNIRATLLVFLYFGVVGAVTSVMANIVDIPSPALAAVGRIAAWTSALAAGITLLYLFVLRLTTQLQMDILAHLLLVQRKHN